MIKSLQEGGGGDDFEIKSISSTRIKNLAKAYAWWIAKDSITFAVLKVGRFLFSCSWNNRSELEVFFV